MPHSEPFQTNRKVSVSVKQSNDLDGVVRRMESYFEVKMLTTVYLFSFTTYYETPLQCLEEVSQILLCTFGIM
jgi:hypothetical protein